MLLIHRNLRKSLVNLHLPKFWEAMMDFFQSEVTTSAHEQWRKNTNMADAGELKVGSSHDFTILFHIYAL